MSDSEEEIVVYANFEEGTVDPAIFKAPNVNFKSIGLNTDTPIVQLGESTFKGTWQDTIGTKVLFESDPNPERVDKVFTVRPNNMYKVNCYTTKCLELSRFFLKPKNSQSDDGEAWNSGMNEDTSMEQD